MSEKDKHLCKETGQTTQDHFLDTLLKDVIDNEKDINSTQVSVVGMPGSGKTTSSAILGSILKETHETSCTVLPMDGYHFSIAQLKAMENPKDVIYRRGAPDTFDANSLRKDLSRIRHGDEKQVCIPGFDHEVGDPNPHEHIFKRSIHDVVIIEGLYLLLEKEKFGWTGIKELFDFSIYIKSDIEDCVKRLKIRNQCIPGYTAEEIAIRCEKVDRVNAEIVETTESFADYRVDCFNTKR